MPRENQPTKADIWSNRADNTMLGVYIGGTFYGAAEYAAILARSNGAAPEAFRQFTLGFAPSWNFIDAIGVMIDAKKDYNNKDKVSAGINVFSGLQLIAGTVVGQIGTHTELPMLFDATIASTLSASTFALCMFCSAGVASYKESCLESEIESLINPQSIDQKNAIIEKIILRNPTHATTLRAWQSQAHNNEAFISILEVERDYQATSKLVWLGCTVAMSIVATTIPFGNEGIKMAAIITLLLSGVARGYLKTQENEMNNKIDRLVNGVKPAGRLKFADANNNRSSMAFGGDNASYGSASSIGQDILDNLQVNIPNTNNK